MASSRPVRTTVRVWDVPTRLFHWTLVVLLVAMWMTGEQRNIALHTQLGAVIVGLLLFRLLWGLFGSETARFRSFLKGPGTVLAYLRGGQTAHVGHNPLGGWSVAAILLVLLAQCGLGLIAHDVDGMESGPLSYLVSYETADLARVWHHRLFDVILVLAALHVTAVVTYFLARDEDLIVPMFTGRKDVPGPAAQPAMASAFGFLVVAGIAASVAWWLAAGAPLPAFLFD